MNEQTIDLVEAQAAADAFRATPEQATALLNDLTAKHKAAQAASRTESESARAQLEGMSRSSSFYERLKAGDLGARKAWDEAIQKANGLDAEGNQVGEATPPPIFESLAGDHSLPFHARQDARADLIKSGLSQAETAILMGDASGPYAGRNVATPTDVATAKMALEIRNRDPKRVAAFLANDFYEVRHARQIALVLSAEIVSDPTEIARLQAGRRT
jgi:hypothetical protein